MKILFLSHSSGWDGAEQCLFHLLKGIDSRKYEAAVVLPGHGRLEEKIHELGIRSRLLEVGWWVKMIPSSQHGGFREGLERRVGALAEVIRQERADLVFTNTVVVVEGALAARLCGVPHVWHILELLSRDPDLVPLLDLPDFYSLLNALTDKVVVVSRSVQAEIGCFVKSEKIQVVYSGIEALNQHVCQDKRRLFNLDPCNPVVSFVGRLSKRKGVLSLADTASLVLERLPNVKFVLAGADGGVRDVLLKRLRKSSVEHAFLLLGQRSDPQDIMASSDVLVLPSLADPLPLVVLEAMRVGRPVVATRSGGAVEMVVDGETGFLVSVDDPSAMAEAIIALLANPEKSKLMGQRGKERVTTLFGYEQHVQSFQRVFDELAFRKMPEEIANQELMEALLRLLDGSARDKYQRDEGKYRLEEERRRSTAREEIEALIPPGETFILVDDDQWGGGEVGGSRHPLPFLERDGQYWGAPPDDDTAIRELERLRRSGASFLAFAWPAFWWLDYYAELNQHLHATFRCALDNDRLVVFDLRSPGPEGETPTAPGDLTKPNDAAHWERIYLTPVEPVARLSSPVARAVVELTRAGDLLLEAGCGSGALSAELATNGRRIELCDFSRAILDRAAELFRVSNLPPPRLTLCDLTKSLPWPDRALDVVWSSGVLEHWTDEELIPIINEMARISRKCVISLVPYAGCVFYRLGKYLAEQNDRWPYGREIPRRTLRPVFQRAGLSNIREYTVWNEWGPRLLGLTGGEMERVIQQWWDSLAEDDPAKDGQGYLLLTVGSRP
jgi:glycosyltransferase involved in cell wall biosynthesis/SAM-dependent methyltransferase